MRWRVCAFHHMDFNTIPYFTFGYPLQGGRLLKKWRKNRQKEHSEEKKGSFGEHIHLANNATVYRR